MFRFVVVAGLALSALACENNTDEPKSEFSAKIDAVFNQHIEPNGPGCSVGVIEQGQFLHKAAYGMANLELGVSLKPSSVFRMASVSKQFTAAAVLLLADEGLVDLDKDIHSYLPELPDYGAEVTVRAMLGHYAGMGDYDLIAGSYEGEVAEGSIQLKSVAGGDYRLGNEDYLTIEEFYQVVQQVPLALKPNEKLEYSNLAYFLLSMLVEKQSGKTLREYSHEKIFKPLGMNNTFFSDDATELVLNRAYGYKPKESGGYVNDMTNAFWVGDGGLHSSVEDLLMWDNNFYKPKLGKNPTDFNTLMNTPNSQHKLDNLLYANGQFVTEVDGRKGYFHSGGWLGTSTFYLRHQDDAFSVVVLCNNAELTPALYVEEIAKSYFN